MPEGKSYNLEPHIAALLAYIVPVITGILFYIIEKENKFVRFHSFQAILFGIVWIAAWAIVEQLKAILIGHLIAPFLQIGFFLTYLWLMWKAYNKEEFELPILGKTAKDQIK